MKNIFLILLSLTCCVGFTAFKVSQQATAVNYVHSKSCRENILQIDCFDKCNGIQIHAKSDHHHKLPSEKIIIETFDGIAIVPTKVIAYFYAITEITTKGNFANTPSLLRNVFRPPIN